ncbi:MAG: hypothetical protein KDD82_01000, partial [Planctomycetes bacterium]|nr:hypothetical protein [Planctomycetota bacterium]
MASGCLLGLLLALGARGDEPPEPLSAWAARHGAVHRTPAGLPEPLQTALPFEDPFGTWRDGAPAARDAFADALIQALEVPRGATLDPLQPGVSREGARAQARRWLGRLPASMVEGITARLGEAPRASPGSIVQGLRAWAEARQPVERARL